MANATSTDFNSNIEFVELLNESFKRKSLIITSRLERIRASQMSLDAKTEIALELFKLGVLKFGEFQLKSGLITPYYINLRIVISKPKLLSNISKLIIDLLHDNISEPIELICGVPYAALPIATCISVSECIPMLICRKEAKTHGTKERIEGLMEKGQKCAIIEDVITFGDSIASVIEILNQEDIVTDFIVILVDREQGGCDALKMKYGIKIFCLYTITELLDIYHFHKLISQEAVNDAKSFIQNNQKKSKLTIPLDLKFNCPQIVKLHQIISSKSTRLCASLDLIDPEQMLQMADQLGPKLCAIKLHLDILNLNGKLSSDQVIRGLRQLATKHAFLIIEDRKLADIGQTVFNQLMYGAYRIAEWCDLVTVHCLPGPGLFDAFRKANQSFGDSGQIHAAALVVAEMSCDGSLTQGTYLNQCVELIRKNHDIIGGIVSQHILGGLDDSQMALPYFVPGIKLSIGCDQLGQHYNSPEQVHKRFATYSPGVVLIVGRGLTESTDPLQEAEKYRLASLK